MEDFKRFDTLVHICCSVDSHFFLQELKKQRPHESIMGFFYDPNIHPYSEYYLRLLDVKRSCQMLDIPLFEGNYDFENWLLFVKGLENEPEKGKRCSYCFDKRLETSMQKAKELGIKQITTTLLTSPKKSIEQLQVSGEELAKKYDLKFVTVDFRKNGGTTRQFELAKQDMLYHQDYCGCLFALSSQRESMQKFADELVSDISQTIMPESIDYRVELYEKRMELEKDGILYKLLREKFLNYRLLRAFVKMDLDIVPSYFLFYSTTKKEFVKNAKVEFNSHESWYLNKEEIRLMSISTYNDLTSSNYKNTKELMFSKKDIKQDKLVRFKLNLSSYSLTPIIVLDTINENAKYSIYCKSVVYEDVIENLVKI